MSCSSSLLLKVNYLPVNPVCGNPVEDQASGSVQTTVEGNGRWKLEKLTMMETGHPGTPWERGVAVDIP